MQYQIEFLDDANAVVRVMSAEAGSPANAFLLVVEDDWPAEAVMANVVDKYGRRGLSVSKPRVKFRRGRREGSNSEAELA